MKIVAFACAIIGSLITGFSFSQPNSEIKLVGEGLMAFGLGIFILSVIRKA